MTTTVQRPGRVDPGVADGYEDVASWPVTAVMTSPAITIPATTSLSDILRAMLGTDRRHLAVLGREGRFVGILDDRAVAAAWARNPAVQSANLAGQLVDHQPAVVSLQATVRDVAAMLVRDRVDAVVVINARGHPVGIVTGRDLVALMARICMPGPVAAAPVPRLD